MEKYLKELFATQQYNKDNFFLIAGPCIVETEEIVMEIAEKVSTTCKRLGIPYVFKASYRKANRTSASSFTGIGDEKALELIKKTGTTFSLPTTTDIHTAEEAAIASAYADILQIPAFLCRQTDLLIAAAQTGRAINVKKGQFVAPWDMRHAVDKVRDSGNLRVSLTERGASFGYNNLVVDMRSLPIMRAFAPVIFDGTHSVQTPSVLNIARTTTAP